MQTGVIDDMISKNFAYSSGSSMASAFNEQTDPGVVFKSFSAS